MGARRSAYGPRRRALLAGQRGAALIMVLVAVSLLGLAAGIAGSSWRSIVQQAKEQDLLWKGAQIRRAIGSYYGISHGQGAPQMFPSKLENLLRDPRFVQTERHLRRLYPDPMTGGDWVLLKDPAGRIKGVRSASKETPFKQDGFDPEDQSLAGKSRYDEWEFVYEPKKKASTTPESPKAETGHNSSSQ